MVNINIVTVGSIKEGYLVSGISEYVKRLSKFCKISITECNECKLPHNASASDIEKVKLTESEELIAHLKGYVILLYITGKSFDSVEFAKTIKKIEQNNSTITFVIGGSYGVSEKLVKLANMCLSFSTFTFPHQLMRLILVEQIYRAFTINNNITYHK